MKAAALHQNGSAFERSRHQLTLVADHAGLREAGNFGVGDAHRVLHFLGEEAQAGSQDDRHAGTALTQTPGHGVRGGTDLRFPGCGRFRHNNIPANVADKKFASVPAIIARNPSFARSCLRLGASAPMPPIWIPTELKLAKPHNANVAMVKDTGSSVALSGPSCAYAMNSFSTIRVPRRPAMVLVSWPGTPITHAIG